MTWTGRGRSSALAFVAATLLLALPSFAGASTTRVTGNPPPWTGPILSAVAWGKSSVIAFGPAGSNSGIYVINPAGGGRHKISTVGGGDEGLSISPDGQTLLFGSGSSMREVRTNGSGGHGLGVGFAPVWSPDGTKIMFERNDGIYIMNADGTGSHKLVTNNNIAVSGEPTWSPNGMKIAYTACSAPDLSQPCEHQSGYDVYVIGVDGSGKHRVTPTSGYPQCPAWSAIGRLAFLAADNTGAIVQAGGGLKTFTVGGCPVWSPNGHQLATTTAKGVDLFDDNGANPTHLTILPNSFTRFLTVAWSGNGKSLAVVGGASAKQLYVINADGSGLKKLF